MSNFLWRIVAFIIARPRVTDWLIARAQRTPYLHIVDADGSTYMGRWWLFNPYAPQSDVESKHWPWLPSVRIHRICRPDRDRHMHDHPWNARTIVLRGFYCEERPTGEYFRARGYTGRLLFGQYHRITDVSAGGVWTMFFTWRKQGTWGFKVDGVKVPWREYLGVPK
ncbi:MAG: hypothetical protein YHS30scaffold667_49 [Phage 65_10]|nr:MAG: hypothetical protein YHS30scaffold667_49 [Phage 65_10]